MAGYGSRRFISRFAEKLTITGKIPNGFKAPALQRAVVGVGVEMNLTTVVVEELATLESALAVRTSLSIRP